MRVSKLFTKTTKNAPSDEVSKNAQLLIRAGFIYKEMAGVYTYLPLGLRVLENIKTIIREEMNREGGQEVVMTALQDKSIWEKTDRWDDKKVDNWFKSTLKNGSEVGLGITHEEPLTRIMSEYVSSYRDLPRYVYQFQNKFRNETRAKSGIMRGREFMMKDMYDFSRNKEEHDIFYAKMREAYKRVFKRTGIGDITYVTFASGGIFSQFSEEFQTLSDAGEDTIFIDEASGVAINKEVYTDEVISQLGLDKSKLVEKRSIETGNIFHLGTKFSESLNLFYTSENGERLPVYMGSYGLGPTRLMGTLVEVLSDEKGIVWPANVAPFKVYLVGIGNESAIKHADDLYKELTDKGIEVIYDDRDVRPGQKFADSELIGIPYRVTVSDRLLADNQYELVVRKNGEKSLLTYDELLDKLV